MTQDEIIEMARDIATQASKVGPYRTWTHEYAMSLIMQLVDASEAKEREACALIAETPIGEYEVIVACGSEPAPHRIPRYLDSIGLAKAIRARGEA